MLSSGLIAPLLEAHPRAQRMSYRDAIVRPSNRYLV